jgi:hypothetical protein
LALAVRRRAGIEPAFGSPQSASKPKRYGNKSRTLAQTLARESQIGSSLAQIIDAWPTLPKPIRRAMLR